MLAADGSDLSSALVALRDDKALAQRISGGGRLVAANRSWDAVARETILVYEGAVLS